ncbi:phage tail tube protein [Streptomyces sp. NPDC052077]|uniref:phage tail tube protein n=1 Tax=Streptomyces sp. NPDC052077 TaxID=3154757 RepID=UPI00342F4F7F
MVLLAQYLSLNAVDVSEHTRKAELTVEVEEKDVTNYKSLGWKEVIGGLKSAELACDFLQDFAAAKLDATMWPLLGSVVPFEVRADQAPAGPGNPSYKGNVLINGWNPVTGSVGDEATVSLGFPTSGAVTRAVS